MKVLNKSFSSYDDLIAHIKTHQPSMYLGSKTSMVIPYDQLETSLELKGLDQTYLCDLSGLPKSMELLENGNLKVSGPVTWQEAKPYCRSLGRAIMTSPTEELACITAGVATSATGERCFGLGNLRSQIVNLEYLDFKGELKTLSGLNKIELTEPLKKYQSSFEPFRDFKNAPFPRFEFETDLMTGTEGQLGVVKTVELKTVPLEEVSFMFLLLPRWEDNPEAHVDLFNKVQSHRNSILSCELTDYGCFRYLPEKERLNQGKDVIFLEVKSSAFEKVYEEFLSKLSFLSDDEIFEIPEARFHQIRAAIPRSVFEETDRQGVVRIGTDVQVLADQFPDLLEFYKSGTKKGIDYCMFGHFGDAHPHFHFLPKEDQVEASHEFLLELYSRVKEWGGTPFAEHGIGTIKLKFMKPFYDQIQREAFLALKSIHDPHSQFFPQGFMSADRES